MSVCTCGCPHTLPAPPQALAVQGAPPCHGDSGGGPGWTMPQVLPQPGLPGVPSQLLPAFGVVGARRSLTSSLCTLPPPSTPVGPTTGLSGLTPSHGVVRCWVLIFLVPDNGLCVSLGLLRPRTLNPHPWSGLPCPGPDPAVWLLVTGCTPKLWSVSCACVPVPQPAWGFLLPPPWLSLGGGWHAALGLWGHRVPKEPKLGSTAGPLLKLKPCG